MVLHCWYKGKHCLYTLKGYIPSTGDELRIQGLGRLRVYDTYAKGDILHISTVVKNPSFHWKVYQDYRRKVREAKRHGR